MENLLQQMSLVRHYSGFLVVATEAILIQKWMRTDFGKTYLNQMTYGGNQEICSH